MIFSGIRGQEHEISIVTKKGVEARTYDGVSIPKEKFLTSMSIKSIFS